MPSQQNRIWYCEDKTVSAQSHNKDGIMILTHLPWTNGRQFGRMKSVYSKGPIDNRPALVDTKPLPEAALTHFTDAYMRH